MSRPLVVVTQRIHDAVRERLAEQAQVEMNDGLEPWPEPALRERLRRADALMAFMPDRVDASLLAAAPRLRIVACALKGSDNFDATACTHAGVWLSIVPDLLTEPTAELALGLAIAAARQVRAGDAWVRSGRFAGWRAHLYGRGLANSVVAVVGLGRVGRAIIDRLQGFGCAQLLGVDPHSHDARTRPATLAQAMAAADFVFLAVPLVAGSRCLVDAALLATVKPGQTLVNIGRGSVVDESAVADALALGPLGAYAADVFAFEDWALPGRPAGISPRLLASPHTVFTPHLGSAVQAVRLAIEQGAADNVLAVLAGQAPPGAVNQPKGYRPTT